MATPNRQICAQMMMHFAALLAIHNRQSVSELSRFLCHALYSAELAACREIPAVMHDLNTPFADHLGRAEGLIWRDAASVSAEMWGELRQDQSCRLTD
jgi:hypothetical protein